MKKAEIKRRKRVVPAHLAGDDQGSIYTTESTDGDRNSMQPPASPYPEMGTQPQHAQMQQPHMYDPQQTQHLEPAEPHPPGGPIPIDFTNAFRSRSHQQTYEASDSNPNPRKRSFSATVEEPQPHYSHAQNLASPPKYHNLDPNLSEPSQQVDRAARRARLRAEAERMRLLLVEKEREIEAMGEEG